MYFYTLQKFFMLIFPFLLALFVFAGCGESEENNNRPVIETVSDQTLDLGNTVAVKVRITYNEMIEDPTFNITSNNTDVATVFIEGSDISGSSSESFFARDSSSTVVETTIAIRAVGAGWATITVSATDNSGQENKVTFNVTVNNPPPDAFCKVGDVLEPGESCFNGNGQAFTVLENGSGQYGYTTVGKGISIAAQNNYFFAEKQDDGTWIILGVMPKE